MSEEIIDAAVLYARLLNSISELISSTIPKGIVDSTIIQINGSAPQQIKPTSPWFNVSIYNSSTSDTIYVMVNRDNADEHAVEADETYDVTMGAAKIDSIYIRTVANGSATVKISAVR